MDVSAHLDRSQDLSSKVARVLERRLLGAGERYTARLEMALAELGTAQSAAGDLPDWWSAWSGYWVDFWQRSVLFWDALRERGNNFVEDMQAGLPPALHFEYETVLDARTFARPVNYALVRITPPPGVKTDPRSRPYVIIDPRAGHGPGIGGFKDDSQVGVALRGGHPVYFVIFFQQPEAGQTLADVCEAERAFVRRVRELHPESPKPAVVGNCQGGWAAMMLAASDPEDTGPLVINGAPMSYWGGAWREGEGDNPMRYAGGLLGGTWLASLASDLGNGRFDGANLVANFENLNPANSFWDKYLHVFRNADTEPPRFLEFERWWGGFYLMNRDEIEWITKNLFVGNRVWTGGGFDLRSIKAPIVLFASLGDNITPPQQAFNWVADVYGSTEEIKARGQVIVGLVHGDAGHLGVFVSGKVAKKEYTQIVSVLESIELLPPGLYAMEIEERKNGGGVEYEVSFQERSLEEVVERLNRFKRADESPFEAVAALSEFNQRAYELSAQPAIQAWSNEPQAEMLRLLHPLRVQRWAVSDLNPWLWWLGPAAGVVKRERETVGPDDALRREEQALTSLVSAWLDYFRDVRDALSEALFFQVYGNLFSLYLADRQEAAEARAGAAGDARELAFVQEALDSLAEGGYPEAVARVAFLLSRKGEPLPLARLELRKDLVSRYQELLPDLPLDQWRRLRGEQEVIVRWEPERALEVLPRLLRDEADRTRLLTLLERLLADEQVMEQAPSEEQLAMVERIRAALSDGSGEN
jgi:pimeloyl-ACP methyl ester carboxylesterase